MFTRLNKLNFLFSKHNFDHSKDYYKILDLQYTASNNSIKQSYFKLAKIYHPDHNPSGQQKFTQIKQAYQILSDENTRKQYDKIRIPYNQTNTNRNKSTQEKNRRTQNQDMDIRNMRKKWTQEFYRTNKYNQKQGYSNKYQRQKEQKLSEEDIQFIKIQNVYSSKNPFWRREELEKYRPKQKSFLQKFELDSHWNSIKDKFSKK